MKPACITALLLALAGAAHTASVAAQVPGQSTEVLAVTDSALAAINRGDSAALTDLMIPEAFSMPILDSTRYAVLSRDQVRAQQLSGVVERGFRPTVHISGPLAVVWLPYDLYHNGTWSHCGIDVFMLVKSGDTWKIASLSWTIEQPPACELHPDGVPQR